MRLHAAVLVVTLAACGGGDDHAHYAVAPKPPNDALIVGSTSATHPPARPRSASIATARSSSPTTRPSSPPTRPSRPARGRSTSDQLTLTYTEGECAQDGPGVYKVVLSKIGVHFTKVDDACESRSHMDNEVWRRF